MVISKYTSKMSLPQMDSIHIFILVRNDGADGYYGSIQD